MKTQALLRALLDASGLNPNSLSVTLKGAATQPQIHKFLKGSVKEPKRRTLQPVADFFGISVEAFFQEELAEKILTEISTGQLTISKRGGIQATRPSSTELPDLLQDWRLQASQRSKEVIDQLILLAKKNALGEEDWELLDKMIERFMKR